MTSPCDSDLENQATTVEDQYLDKLEKANPVAPFAAPWISDKPVHAFDSCTFAIDSREN